MFGNQDVGNDNEEVTTTDADLDNQNHDDDRDNDTDTDRSTDTDTDTDNDGEGEGEGGEGGEGNEGEDDEEEFTFDGEALAAPATDDDDQENDSETVKRLRATIREQKRALKQSTQQQPQQSGPVPLEVPPKPQLGDEGIDWDPEKLAEKLDEWHEQKGKIEARQQEQQQRAQKFQTQLEERGKVYREERATAIKKIAGYERAEEIVAELPEPLQAALLLNSQKPTLTVMALARNEKLRQEIEEAYTNDHIRLGYLIADIDRRAGTAPKVKKDVNGAPQVKGNGGAKNIGQLEAARAKAQQSGDWTEYFAMKEKLKKD